MYAYMCVYRFKERSSSLSPGTKVLMRAYRGSARFTASKAPGALAFAF